MKVFIAIIGIIFLLSPQGMAQSLPIGYAGLFTGDTHSGWCLEGEGFYHVEMWVMCLPSWLGQICAEFEIDHPSNVIESTITWNDPVISVVLGCPKEGVTVCFIECQWGGGFGSAANHSG